MCCVTSQQNPSTFLLQSLDHSRFSLVCYILVSEASYCYECFWCLVINLPGCQPELPVSFRTLTTTAAICQYPFSFGCRRFSHGRPFSAAWQAGRQGLAAAINVGARGRILMVQWWSLDTAGRGQTTLHPRPLLTPSRCTLPLHPSGRQTLSSLRSVTLARTLVIRKLRPLVPPSMHVTSVNLLF